MPRRNYLLLIIVIAVSLICYRSVQTNRFGRVMVEAMGQIQRRSLKEIEQKDLFEGAMAGMIGRLNDPYSAYMPPKESEDFNEQVDQQFAGVGMAVSMSPKTDQLMVTNPVVGRPAPAYEQGIRAGDVIRRIDDHSTQGLSLADAVGYMRGKPGSRVVLGVLHRGQQRPVEIEVIRQDIQVDSVLGDVRMVEDLRWNFFLEGYDRIGYMRITAFAQQTHSELHRALEWLRTHDAQGIELKEPRNLRGLILDLRGNPGGLLTAAEKMCDRFIDSGLIVTRNRRNEKLDSRATAPGTYLGFPMAVLVNPGSASASEIVAACLQDHGRAVVVGQRTYGKGTVQEVITLPDGRGAIRLTTSGYSRPDAKKNIHRGPDDTEDDVWGVLPSPGFEVTEDRAQRKQRHEWRVRRDLLRLDPDAPDAGDALDIDVDVQLAKAVEYIEAPRADHPGVLPAAAAVEK